MDDSSIESQETMIKKQLKIEEEEQITFTFIGEDEEYPEENIRMEQFAFVQLQNQK